jgi:simple sugar transport system substrate-binding protein
MTHASRRELLQRLAAVGAGALLTDLPALAQQGRSAGPLRLGFVYPTLINSAGPTYQHDQGRLIMEQALGEQVVSTHLDNIAAGPAAEKALRDLARQGHRLVFAISPIYQDAVLKVAPEFPTVGFELLGPALTLKGNTNISTYNARLYEGRYVAGVIAGAMSRSGQVGCVAGVPTIESIQGINAFTIGMRSVQPQAQLRLLWTGAVIEANRERQAAQTLLDQGADLLSFDTASTAIPALAQSKNIYFIGHHSDWRHTAPNTQLTSVTHQWGKYYTEEVRALMAGRWKVHAFDGNLRAGAVKVLPLAPAIPDDVQRLVKERERHVVAGNLHPFGGRIVDQDGKVRQAQGVMKDADLARMDYLVQGVVGSLPR